MATSHITERSVIEARRGLLVLMLLVAAFLPAWAAAPHLENERVLGMNSKVTVRKNGALAVREIIDVNVLGITLQSGMIREFDTALGIPAPKVTVKRITMDEKPVPFKMDELGGVQRIVIGDPDQPLTTGIHQFVLEYETASSVRELAGRDRFAWNVTGSNWNLPIDSVETTIELPKGIPIGDLSVEGTTGGAGVRAKRYTFDFDTPGAVAFAAQALAPNEGLTVVLDWPSGYVRHRSWGVPVAILENTGVFVTLAGLLLVGIYWVVLWFRNGRGPVMTRLAARPTPPAGVSAVGLRYLKQQASDGKMFMILLVSLARLGAVAIDEEEDSYTLKRTNADFHALAPEVREFAKSLFGTQERLPLKMNAMRVKTAMRVFRNALQKSYSRSYVAVSAFAWPALTASAVTVFVGMLLEARPNLKEEFLPDTLLLLVFVVCTVLLRQLWPGSLKEWKQSDKEFVPGVSDTKKPEVISATIVAALLLGVSVMLAVKAGWLWMLVVAGITVLNLWFMKKMHVPSARGQRLLDEVEAFRLYLRKLCAESVIDSEGPEERTATFEEFADHALAFDLEADWIQRVAGTLERGEYRPAWYEGEHFRNFYLRKKTASSGQLPGLEGIESIAGGRFAR